MECDVCLPCTRIKSVFICPFDSCTKTFSKKSRLTHHVMTHTGERPHKCPITGCSKKYVRAAHLKRHLQTSHSEEQVQQGSFQCAEDGCEKVFKTQAALKKHCRNQHEEQPKYKCTEAGCTESFRKKCQLRAHLYSHKGVLPFQCEHPDCKKKFAQKSHLERHKKVHNGYKCDVAGCSEVFPKFSLLRRHRSQTHRSVFTCPNCGKTFTRPAALRCHSRVHSDSREVFDCPRPGCDRFYFTLSNLNAHIQSYHNNQRFSCVHEGCGRTFASKKKLVLHQKLHDPNRPKKKRKGHSKGGVKRSHVVTKLTGVPTSVLNSVKLDIAKDTEFSNLDNAIENCINMSGNQQQIISGASSNSEKDSNFNITLSHTGSVNDGIHAGSGSIVPSETAASCTAVSLTDIPDAGLVAVTDASYSFTISLTDSCDGVIASLTDGDHMISVTDLDHAVSLMDDNHVIAVVDCDNSVFVTDAQDGVVTSLATADAEMQTSCSGNTASSLADGCKDIVISQTDVDVTSMITESGVSTQVSHVCDISDLVLYADSSDNTAEFSNNNISGEQMLEGENIRCLCKHLPQKEDCTSFVSTCQT